jgi:hypothetical protein
MLDEKGDLDFCDGLECVLFYRYRPSNFLDRTEAVWYWCKNGRAGYSIDSTQVHIRNMM